MREHREQLLRLNGLNQVIVEPCLLGCLAIARLAVTREGNQANAAVSRISAHSACDLESVHAGQPDVQQDDLGRDFVNQPECCPPVSGAVTGQARVR